MSSDESTRRQILEAAYDLFVERGFQGSSMRNIADEAGIKAASIYNHFEGKESIFREVFKERHPLFRLLAILDSARGETAEELLTSAPKRLNTEIRNDEFAVLRIPNRFLLDNRDRFDTKSANVIRLHLAAYPENWLVDERVDNGVDFSQFELK